MGRKPVSMNVEKQTVTQTLQGHPQGIYILMDGEYALTSDHYYTSQVAALALRQSLVRHLAPYGYTVEVETNYFAQPQERFQLQITCQPASLAGLPASTLPQELEHVLPAVREAISAAAAAPLDATDLKGWKERLMADVKLQLASPSGFVNTLLDRYANNKDIASRYSESISAINEARVQEFLGILAAGGRIEFLVP
jgi:hypothetical protein